MYFTLLIVHVEYTDSTYDVIEIRSYHLLYLLSILLTTRPAAVTCPACVSWRVISGGGMTDVHTTTRDALHE